MPQPRSLWISALSQGVARGGSGERWTPSASMSSPVLAITLSSEPTSSCIPAASLAPPVPPARSATRISRLCPVVAVRQTREADAGVRLVAGVDRDQQRRQLLDDAGHLQGAGVDRAQAGDQLDQAGDACLVGLLVAADEHVLR